MIREIREILVAILNGHCDLDFIIFYLFPNHKSYKTKQLMQVKIK
jgi:hypothetical protein